MSGKIIATMLDTSLVGHGGTFALYVPDGAEPEWIAEQLQARSVELLGDCPGVGPQTRLLLSLHRVTFATCRLATVWLMLRNRHERAELLALVSREIAYLVRDLDRPQPIGGDLGVDQGVGTHAQAAQ